MGSHLSTSRYGYCKDQDLLEEKTGVPIPSQRCAMFLKHSVAFSRRPPTPKFVHKIEVYASRLRAYIRVRTSGRASDPICPMAGCAGQMGAGRVWTSTTEKDAADHEAERQRLMESMESEVWISNNTQRCPGKGCGRPVCPLLG
jgi:hypothetical protein